jgi:hypothetical protein
MRRNWRKEAQTAVDELKSSKYGERETTLRALARRFKYKSDDPSSLRRGIAAHEFLERLRQSHPVEYDDLQDVPLSVAELIARWHAADPARALTAARDWARGTETVKSIRGAMEVSLPKGYGGLVGAASERAYRAGALKQVTSAVENLTGSSVRSSTTRQRDPVSGLKYDFMFEISRANGKERIAVLIVGPYTNPNMYRDRCDEWIARAFGLAWIFDRVVLAIPAADYLESYRDRARAVAKAAIRPNSEDAANARPDEIRYPTVDAVHIKVDPFEAQDSEALSKLDNPTS